MLLDSGPKEGLAVTSPSCEFSQTSIRDHIRFSVDLFRDFL